MLPIQDSFLAAICIIILIGTAGMLIKLLPASAKRHPSKRMIVLVIEIITSSAFYFGYMHYSQTISVAWFMIFTVVYLLALVVRCRNFLKITSQ